MSGIFGGGARPSGWQTPVLAGLQIQQAGYSKPVPIVYGTARVSPTLMYYADWTVIPHTTTTNVSGGKGGGTTISNTNYTYSATVCFELAEGPVQGVSRIWRNQVTYANPAAVGFTIFTGTYPQSPWGYLSTYHPTQAIGYQGSAYAAFANYDLGSGSLGNHLFEVQGIFTSPGVVDVNPKDVITDFLTNPHYGVLFPGANLGDYTALGNYCSANGILISPAVATQRPAHDWLAEWARIANAGIVWSEKRIKIIPYDQIATAVYDLTDDDFIVKGAADPIVVTRKRRADAYNDVTVEYLDRGNDYTAAPATARDQSALEIYGMRSKPTVTLHSVCLGNVAQLVAQAILQRELYILNTYQFNLSQKYCLLEPMDVVTLTDPMLGMNKTPVRITEIQEGQDGLLQITAEQYAEAFYNPAAGTPPPATGYNPNWGVVPSLHSAAELFLAPSTLAPSGYEIWMAVTNLDANYGGSQIWMSYDDATFFSIGTIRGNSIAGVTTANLVASVSDPDTSDTLTVDLTMSAGVLSSVNQTTVDTYGTLSLVGSEFLAWRDASLTAVSKYNLSYLHRGLYNSAQGSSVGARFILCDAGLFRYPYNPQLVGSTVYFKFVAFNQVGAGVQNMADIPSVPFTIAGQLALPAAPSGLSVSQSGTTTQLSWVASPTAGVSYEIRYVPQGNISNWNDGVVLATGIAYTSFNTTGMVPGAWIFLLAARDASGTYSAQAVQSFTVANTLTVQATLIQAPQWPGTLTNMVQHWTGKLVPQSQNLANADLWDTFDKLVPNPYPACSFESAQIVDLTASKTVRAWAAFAGTLPIPGGSNSPQFWINASSDGVNYAGYSQWGNGTLTARFIKTRAMISTVQGTPCLSMFTPTFDM